MGAGVSITCSGRGMRTVRARTRGRGAVGGADGAWLAPLRSASARLGALRRRRELPSAKVAWRCPTWRRHWPRASPARGTNLRLAFRAAVPEFPSPGTPPARPEPDAALVAPPAAGFPAGTQRKEGARRLRVSLSHGQRGELGRGRAPRRAGGGGGGSSRRRGWRGGEPLAHRDPGRHGSGSEPTERGGEETDRCCHVKGAGAAQRKRYPGRCGAAFHAQARTA